MLHICHIGVKHGAILFFNVSRSFLEPIQPADSFSGRKTAGRRPTIKCIGLRLRGSILLLAHVLSWRAPLMHNCPIIGQDRSLGLQEFEAPKIYSQLAHECGKVVTPTHWPPSSPEDIPGTYLCQRLSRLLRPCCGRNV
jgi:hypothetical protein